MRFPAHSRLSCLLLAAAALSAQTSLLPLKDVKPGMKGIGRTIFSGSRIDEFQVEVLGILENAGPKQSIILARLSGGPLDSTGVLQGMSGSPVYIGGKLVGAVALAFPFSKEPIAGIRPIEEMIASAPAPRATAALRFPFDAKENLPRRAEYDIGPSKLVEIATPLWLSGFSRGAIEHFAPALRAAGLEPVQGISGGGKPTRPTSQTPRLEPGSMISVQLITGDMGVGADGTVTHVDGNRVYAFGHRFLSVGDTALPFARSEVLALLPSQNTSFKITTPREWMGLITRDSSTAVTGELGRMAHTVPLTIRVRSRGATARETTYKMELVEDRLFTPLLLQMAVYSAVEATERTVGLGTITLHGQMALDGAPPVHIDNVYSSELGAPQQAAGAVAAPVAAVLQSGFEAFQLKSLDLEFEVSNEKRQLQLDNVWASRREVRPGETVEINALFTGEKGQEVTRTVQYAVPIGAPAGPLYFTITDGPTENLTEYRQFLTTPPRNAPQLYSFLTGLRSNDRAFVRVWRQTPSWQIAGDTFASAPASAALTMGRGAALQPSSKVAEIEMPSADFLFSGSKTLQVDVKE